MAAINHIPLDTYNGGLAAAAVVFNLATPAPESRLFSELDGWEVELKVGCSSVVARTLRELNNDELHEQAINVTGKALDMAAVMDFEALLLKAPGDDFVTFKRCNLVKLTIQNIVDFSVTVTPPKISIVHADGTVEEPKVHNPDWLPAFRFYRLSQAGTDLFEAYRNLFLALEALLDQLFPKQKNEGEKRWLYRSFNELETKVDLSQYMQNLTDKSTKGLVDWLYLVRVNLFHAKSGRTYVPEVGVRYVEVSAAYKELVQIWRKVVEKFLRATPRGGMLMRGGFRMMAEVLGKGHIVVSPDRTPVSKEEESFSPNGEEMFVFSEAVSMSEDGSGRILLSSVENIKGGRMTTIGRTGIIMSDGSPALASDDFGLFDMHGVEQLEVIFHLRLINKKQPRTEF